MRMTDLIEKKKQGLQHSPGEINFIVDGYTRGSIPDYQMSAWMMAVNFKGLDDTETAELTMAMARSGDMLDLSGIKGVKADKHSTGGVGDKTTLIVCPIVACLGVDVAKMSGRGLGHTGGTIDKLESIPGFRTALSDEDFISQVNSIHFALASQTADLAPADRKMYALRDVTASVDQKSLIASSIMSKKLAAGADVITLDVKTGSGAFMKDIDSAVELAKLMVSIGKKAGKRVSAVISDMNEPLGHNVGNALEVMEAIDVLKGGGEKRLKELCLFLASEILLCAGITSDRKKADSLVKDCVESGRAFDKFLEFVSAQGGDTGVILHPERFDLADERREVRAPEEGFLSSCDTKKVGLASLALGGGRSVKDAPVDHGVGIILHKSLGEHVDKGEAYATILGRDSDSMSEACALLSEAYVINKTRPESRPLIYGTVTVEDVS